MERGLFVSVEPGHGIGYAKSRRGTEDHGAVGEVLTQ